MPLGMHAVFHIYQRHIARPSSKVDVRCSRLWSMSPYLPPNTDRRRRLFAPEGRSCSALLPLQRVRACPPHARPHSSPEPISTLWSASPWLQARRAGSAPRCCKRTMSSVHRPMNGGVVFLGSRAKARKKMTLASRCSKEHRQANMSWFRRLALTPTLCVSVITPKPVSHVLCH